MSAREFRDDDAGYLHWLAAHPDGYVINIGRGRSAAEARLHHAGCRTISGQNPRGGPWTGQYIKVCTEHLAELEQWAIDQVGEPIRRCGICHQGRHGAALMSPARTEPAADPAPKGRCDVHGPVPGGAVVEAWADDYIRFERRPAWQERLRTEIRRRCTQLRPADEQLLHATFFGTKLPNADVENLVLYNIDSFADAGRNGIRVEYDDTLVPPAPDGGRYRFCYRYALVPRSGGFNHWRQGRTLASFDWTDLGDFAGDKKLAQVWLALARSRDERLEPACPPGTPFAVKVNIRPPHRLQRVWGGLVKGIFDGVVCAFQAHTDTAVLPEVVERLARVLPAEPAEIEQLLLDQRRAALGVVPRLVAPYRKGVKWDPADHLCLAGELLVADAVGDRWAIKGEVVELSSL